MRVLVTTDNRFLRLPDGTVWAPAQGPYSYWQTFLDVFDRVHFIARVQDVETIPPDLKRADGKDVTCGAIPDFNGPMQYIRNIRSVNRSIKAQIDFKSAVVLRIPSILGTVAFGHLQSRGFPYGVNVVQDPWLAFSAHGVQHPLRIYFRWKFTQDLKNQCRHAVAAWYVTKANLQARYPCEGYSIGASDVQIKAADIRDEPRHLLNTGQKIILIFVGSLAQLYKAPDVLIDAFAQCVRQGLDLELVMVGDGKYRHELEDRARHAGMADRIHFVGMLPGADAVREKLDEADLFILPSRSEGLPRAMIEAMARGLPCIGTAIAGIPELLEEKALVQPDNIEALASKIKEFVTNPQLMYEQSRHNLRVAREYEETVLRQKRIAFLQHVKTRTQEWLNRREQQT